MGKLTGKRLARQAARAYVAELLRGDDQPDWPEDRGYFASDSAEALEFMNELLRIADRIDASITPAGRRALHGANRSG